MNKIYSLNWDYNHSGDTEKDAFHIPFEHSDKSSILFMNPKYKDKLPSRVLFRANFNVIPDIDYPLTDLNIPILSDRMISVLNQAGDANVIYTDVVMIDDTYSGDIFDGNKNLKSELKKVLSYKAITIINREDCFDYEKSVFEPSELNPQKPGYIEKLVLKTEENLPPIFRIKESPSRLLITERVKIAMVKTGVKGCVFEPVETS